MYNRSQGSTYNAVQNLELANEIAHTFAQFYDTYMTMRTEEARRDTIKMETEARLKSFQMQFEALDAMLSKDCATEEARLKRYFDAADKLIEQGKDDAALKMIELYQKNGHISLTKLFIEYHKEVSLSKISTSIVELKS